MLSFQTEMLNKLSQLLLQIKPKYLLFFGISTKILLYGTTNVFYVPWKVNIIEYIIWAFSFWVSVNLLDLGGNSPNLKNSAIFVFNMYFKSKICYGRKLWISANNFWSSEANSLVDKTNSTLCQQFTFHSDTCKGCWLLLTHKVKTATHAEWIDKILLALL